MPRYPYSQCQTARCRMCPAPTLSIRSNRNSFRTAVLSSPRRLRRPGYPSSCCHPRGDGGAPTGACSLLLCRACLGRGAHLAIGALASRRSAVTVLGRECPRIPFPALLPEPSREPRRGSSVSPGGGLQPPGPHFAGTPRPLRHQDRLRRRPSSSGMCEYYDIFDMKSI